MMAESFVPSTKELEALKRNTGKLQRAITDHRLLSMDLFSANLISLPTLQKVNTAVTTPEVQCYEIINNLLQAIVYDPKNFWHLLKVLESHPPLLTAAAKDLKEDYESIINTHDQHPDIKAANNTDGNQKRIINVGRSMQQDYDQMRGKLAGLVFDFQKVVEAAHINIDDLKQYIRLYDPDKECSEELRIASNVSEVFVVVRRKLCSLFNYSVLLRIAEKFNLVDGLKVIQSYEAEEENYRKILASSTLAEELKKENELLNCNSSTASTIILKLRWQSVKPLTVSEFEAIIKEVFSELYCFVHLLKVESGSIVVTMCAPEQVIAVLIKLAEMKTTYLKEKGVQYLAIADNIIIKDTAKVLSSEISVTEKFMINQLYKTVSKPLVKGKHDGCGTEDIGDDDSDQGTCREETDSATPLCSKIWRHHSHGPRDVMIISSFDTYSTWPIQYIVSPKLLPTAQLWTEEVKRILKLYKRNPDFYHLKSDPQEKEETKKHSLESLKQLLINCEHLEATIYYTGHGEKNTGNWCFKDGVISFNDIFFLYMKHFKGKSLTIISDCSYSGNWINDCGKRLDEMRVPSCGHHTRKQDLLINIFASCQPNEEATVLCYINEALVYDEVDGMILITSNKALTSGQTPIRTDFRDIRCGKIATEHCEADSNCTWRDCLSNNIHRLRLVRGKEDGLQCWHFVLLHEDKVEEYKGQVATGTINISNYGKIIQSGVGKDPPVNILRKIGLRFGQHLTPL